jgi:hypothetical protein
MRILCRGRCLLMRTIAPLLPNCRGEASSVRILQRNLRGEWLPSRFMPQTWKGALRPSEAWLRVMTGELQTSDAMLRMFKGELQKFRGEPLPSGISQQVLGGESSLSGTEARGVRISQHVKERVMHTWRGAKPRRLPPIHDLAREQQERKYGGSAVPCRMRTLWIQCRNRSVT